MSFVTHIFKRYLNIKVNKGPFMGNKFKYGSSIKESDFEEVYEKIRKIQNNKVTEVSPFHIVFRTNSFRKLNNKDKIICRKLGLHSKNGFEPVILPNTPHFNLLLWEIKSFISLKPVKFTDGLPSENDIGQTKINHLTGEVKINPIYKVSDFRIENGSVSELYQGRYLREYLKKLIGILTITTRN